MIKRSAEATIKGYYYQFDLTILKLLETPKESDIISIEGIEDIDINTATEKTVVQCKYLSKSHYIDSAVREPIIHMLNHFISNKEDVNYTLYCHFENSLPGSEPIIDLDKIKKILTYTESKSKKHYEIENGISDTQLNEFLKKFKMQFGLEFYTQQKKVINLLMKKFTCSETIADLHYYNNALRVILDYAIDKNVKKRQTTGKQFFNDIDNSSTLFNEWFIKLKSKKEYLLLAKQNLKVLGVPLLSRTKTFVIGREILEANNTELPVTAFIENLVSKYYTLNKILREIRPLTLILDCDLDMMLSIKKYLVINNILFNDGHENLTFVDNYFNSDPIINLSGAQKISKSSFLIKILSKEVYDKNITSIKTTQIYVNFAREDNKPISTSSQFVDVKYCETLKEIYSLLI